MEKGGLGFMHPRSSDCTQFLHNEIKHGGISQGESWGHISQSFFYLILTFQVLRIFMMVNVCQEVLVGRLLGRRGRGYVRMGYLKRCMGFWIKKKRIL